MGTTRRSLKFSKVIIESLRLPPARSARSGRLWRPCTNLACSVPLPELQTSPVPEANPRQSRRVKGGIEIQKIIRRPLYGLSGVGELLAIAHKGCRRNDPRRGAFRSSIPAVDAQHESARFSVPTAARWNADGLIIDAVKDIVDAQRRAPVSIDLITGAEVDHSERALHVPK
jgi:hypothetical protein